jgi:hypothetical protein
MRILWLLLPFLSITQLVFGQVTNTGLMDTLGGEKIKNVTIGGYVDSYFTYGFNQPKDGTIPLLVSSANHNDFSINLAYLDLRYTDSRVRARLVPGFGTYMNANYSNEKGLFKNIVEASVGICLSKKRNIWLESGIIGSPFTNESAISKDHFMYTRSLSAEYVPYYLTGIKASIPLSSKWNLYTYILNGWQQITDQNSGKSVATQLEYRPNESHLINWNTYLGDERNALRPDYRMRYFSDIYWIASPFKKFSFITCMYGGIQQILHQKEAFWLQANFSGKWKLSEKQSIAGRIEYFQDPKNCMMSNPFVNQKINLISTGLCYTISFEEHALIRLDARQFFSQNALFTNQISSNTENAFVLTGNVTVWF